MSSKSLFNIPSADEMAKSSKQESNVQSLFSSHQSKIRARIQESMGKSPQKEVQQASQNVTKTLTVSNSPPEGPSCTKTASSSQVSKISGALPQEPEVVKMKFTESQMPGKSSETLSGTTNIPPVLESTNNTSKERSEMGVQKATKTNCIIVSPRQRGNPILKYIRNVPWEFGETVADYEIGQTSCALFLSLRYHNLNPNYIHERLKQLAHSYKLRVLLVHVDVKDPHHALQELASICILSDCTLMLAFSPEEAGRYLETYKSFENKPPDLIMEKTEGNFLTRFTDCLTSVKKINKTDATTLLTTFGSFEKITSASEEDLSLCPGIGPQKAQRLYAVLREPFLKFKKRSGPKSSSDGASPTKQHKPGTSDT